MKAKAFLLSIFAIATLASCSKSDEPAPDATPDKYQVDFNTTLGKDILSYFDVTVEYNLGVKMQLTQHISPELRIFYTIPSSQVVEGFTYIVTATPKANDELFDASATYDFSCEWKAIVSEVYGDKYIKAIMDNSGQNINRLTGEQAKKYITQQHVLVNVNSSSTDAILPEPDQPML